MNYNLHQLLIIYKSYWRQWKRHGKHPISYPNWIYDIEAEIITQAKQIGWSWHPQMKPSASDIAKGRGHSLCSRPGQDGW
jgi:hypothetical protein